MATEEIWVPIQGSNGAYEISNQGRIRSIPRKVLRRGYGEYPVRGRILKPCTAVGYYAYWVYIEGKGKLIKTHRVVALHFIDNPLGLPCINHIDGNKKNNSLSNLEWCTQGHNNQHAWDNGLNTGNRREVIQKSTGIVFTSVRAAARHLGMRLGAFRYRLGNSNIPFDFSYLSDS